MGKSSAISILMGLSGFGHQWDFAPQPVDRSESVRCLNEAGRSAGLSAGHIAARNATLHRMLKWVPKQVAMHCGIVVFKTGGIPTHFLSFTYLACTSVKLTMSSLLKVSWLVLTNIDFLVVWLNLTEEIWLGFCGHLSLGLKNFVFMRLEVPLSAQPSCEILFVNQLSVAWYIALQRSSEQPTFRRARRGSWAC